LDLGDAVILFPLQSKPLLLSDLLVDVSHHSAPF
jgi:hypothetical protein